MIDPDERNGSFQTEQFSTPHRDNARLGIAETKKLVEGVAQILSCGAVVEFTAEFRDLVLRSEETLVHGRQKILIRRDRGLSEDRESLTGLSSQFIQSFRPTAVAEVERVYGVQDSLSFGRPASPSTPIMRSNFASSVSGASISITV